jgi:hypothetical protein
MSNEQKRKEFFQKLQTLLGEYNVDMTAEFDDTGEYPVIEFSGYDCKITDDMSEMGDYDLWMFSESQYLGPTSETPKEYPMPAHLL